MENKSKFTSGQQKAYDLIMSGRDVFVTGGAGTGKSFLIRSVLRGLRERGKNCIVCAPTAAAAANVGGITVHRAFGFGAEPCITEKTNKITVRTPKLVCASDAIIIDEVSMCRLDMMDAVLASVQKARKKAGHGIQMLLFGDFCQLPPVINEAMGEREILEAYYGRPVGNGFAFQADGWRKAGFAVAELAETVRQEDDVFIRNLNALRLGDTSAIRYFNTMASYEEAPADIGLFAYNRDVDSMNRNALKKLKGDPVTFEPIYYGQDIRDVVLPGSVTVKIGARVVITTNDGYHVSEEVGVAVGRGSGFHNGSTGKIVDAFRDESNPRNDYVVVRLDAGGRYMFQRQTRPIFDFRLDEGGNIRREVIGNISLIPVKPAYAVTIHRGQGQTYDRIFLDPTCWTPGQLYVALSRLRSIEGLHLRQAICPEDLRTDPLVREFYEHLHDPCYVPSWERGGEMLPAENEKDAVPGDVPDMQKNYGDDPQTETSDAACHGKGENAERGVKSPKRSRKPMGRPPRYPNGSWVVRIPNEITEEIEWLLSVICPSSGIDMDELEIFKMMVYRMRETYIRKRGN